MVEYRKVEFLFFVASVYAFPVVVLLGIAVDGFNNKLGMVVWFALGVVVAILTLYVYNEFDRVKYTVMSVASVRLATRLPLSVMWGLRRRVAEYRRLGREIDRLLEEKRICVALKGIRSDINCENFDERIKQLEEKQELIAEEIREAVYNYYFSRLKGWF